MPRSLTIYPTVALPVQSEVEYPAHDGAIVHHAIISVGAPQCRSLGALGPGKRRRKNQFSRSLILSMPAIAHASSLSPPGAPPTAMPPIVSSPTLIGTPPCPVASWLSNMPGLKAPGVETRLVKSP